jgi:hypothetical protein
MSNEAENNKLIDIFMTGRELMPNGKTLGFKQGYPKQYENWYDTVDICNLTYHRSWSRLMPVVEKIMAHQFDDDEFAYLRTFAQRSSTEWMVRINRFTLHTDKTLVGATYKAVIEFINWYNLNMNP